MRWLYFAVWTEEMVQRKTNSYLTAAPGAEPRWGRLILPEEEDAAGGVYRASLATLGKETPLSTPALIVAASFTRFSPCTSSTRTSTRCARR